MNKLITFIENKIRNIIEVEIGLVLNKCKKNIKTQFQSKHVCCMLFSRVGNTFISIAIFKWESKIY